MRAVRRTDGGKNWQELSGLRGHGNGPNVATGAAVCVCTQLCWIRPMRKEYGACRAGEAFDSERCRKKWLPINRGLEIAIIPSPGRK